MVIALDSNVFIYWLENNPDFYEESVRLVADIHAGRARGVCSVLAYGESYKGTNEVFDAIDSIENLRVYDMTKGVAQLAGRIRHEHRIKGLDAIHLATAILAGADTFITNDRTLTKLTIPGLTIKSLK